MQYLIAAGCVVMPRNEFEEKLAAAPPGCKTQREVQVLGFRLWVLSCRLGALGLRIYVGYPVQQFYTLQQTISLLQAP